MFKNLKIGVRLGLGFGIVLLILASVVAVGMTRMSAMNGDTEKLVQKDWVKVRLITEIKELANDNARANLELFLTKDRQAVAKLQERVDANKKHISENLDKLEGLIYRAEGKAALAKIKEARGPYVASFTRASKLLLEDRKAEEASRVMTSETMPALTAYLGALNELVRFQGEIFEETGRQAAQNYESGRVQMIAAGLAALVIGLLFAWWITRSITRPLGRAVEASNRLAAGDLTVGIEVASKDEAGQLLAAMKNMVEKLSQIITEVRSAADTLSSASEEVSATAQSMSQGATEQASSVEETSASMEQMSASIGQNAENAKVTDGIAAKAATEATEGGEAVKQTVNAMKSIAQKISIIDDIAYQTNLLALNAAIEAARAGEHGKGFAVVAAEVRKLAERSQVAAQEIGEVAGSSVQLAEKAGTLLDEIVPSIRKTSDLVQEIAAASQEQSSGTSQINAAVNQMSQLTQRNAAASEELAATAEEMSSQAEQLQQLVAFFRVDTGAVAHAGAHVPPKAAPAKRPAPVHIHPAVHADAPERAAPKPAEALHEAPPARKPHSGNGADHSASEFVRF